MKAYLLTYSGVLFPEYVHSVLNSSNAVKTWVSPFPYSAIIISDLELNELTAICQVHFFSQWFILTELSPTSVNGFLPKEFWDFINDPMAAWRKRLFAQIAAPLPPLSISPPPAPPDYGDKKRER